jgi:hypothetical protein
LDPIAASQLSTHNLVREKFHSSFTFRVAAVSDYATALTVEAWVKSGSAGCGPPRLNLS